MKRLFNFDCPKCGPVELLAKHDVTTRHCFCGEVVSKSKKAQWHQRAYYSGL